MKKATALTKTKQQAVSTQKASTGSGISVTGPTRLISDEAFMAGDPFLGYSFETPQPMANHAWVYAAIRAISQNIGGVPLAIRGGKNGEKIFTADDERESAGKALAKVLEQPNRFMNGFQLLENTVALMNLDGIGFWILNRANMTQVPKEIIVDSKRTINAVVSQKGNPIGWQYRPTPTGEPISLRLDQVLVFKFFNPYDPIWGLSPLEAAKRGVKVDILASVFGQAFFENSADPGGIITSEKKLSTRQAKELINLWEERHRGPGNAKKVGILYGGMKWQSTAISQKDMEFIEQRKWTRDEILAVFKVPKSEISLFEDVSYSTAQSQDKGFWQKTLIPIMKNIESVLKAHLIPGLRGVVDPRLKIFFDLAIVNALQPDFDAQVTNAEKLFRIGYPINAINERLQLGMPKVDWGDVWYVNSAIMPIDKMLEQLEQDDEVTDMPGAKPPGLRTPGVDGNPPEAGEDNPEDTETPSPPSPDDNNNQKTVVWRKLKRGNRITSCNASVTTHKDSRKRLQTTHLFSELEMFAGVLKAELRKYFWRLRAYQLANIVSSPTLEAESTVFCVPAWNEKLRKRVSPVYSDISECIERAFNKGKVPIEANSLYALNTFVRSKIVKAVEAYEPDSDRSALLDSVRNIFNSVSNHSQLLAIAHIEMGRILKQVEQGDRNNGYGT